MRNASRKLSAVVLALWFVAGLAACGGGGDPATKTVAAQALATTTAAPAGGGTTTKTVTVQAPATTTAAPAKSSTRGGALATYQPSAVISEAGGSETITSPDPVSKVTAFYATQLRKGGWTTTSETVTDYSGNFNAQRGNEGVHISTYTRRSGSGATISTHPIAATTTAAPAKSSSRGGALATYQPSAVISNAGGSETITSPDPVSKVTAFYATQLRKGGWTITSKTVTDYSGNFNAQRGNEGVHISTYTRGSGSGATISRHPI